MEESGEHRVGWRGEVDVRRLAPFREALGVARVVAARDGEVFRIRPILGAELEARAEEDAVEGRLRGRIGGSTIEVLLPIEGVTALELGPFRAPRTNGNGVPEGWERGVHDPPTRESQLEFQRQMNLKALPYALALLAAFIAWLWLSR